MCGAHFVELRNLTRHTREVHYKKGRVICDLCGRDFPRKDNIKGHFKTIHGIGTTKNLKRKGKQQYKAKSESPSKITTKVYYSDMKFRCLTLGKHKVMVLSSDFDVMVLYVVESLFTSTFNRMTELVEEAAKSYTKDSYSPDVNEMVLALFEGNFHRAVVLGKCPLDESQFSIFFVDHGNVAFCRPKDLKPIGIAHSAENILHEVIIENLSTPVNESTSAYFGFGNEITIDVKERTPEGNYKCDFVGL